MKKKAKNKESLIDQLSLKYRKLGIPPVIYMMRVFRELRMMGITCTK